MSRALVAVDEETQMRITGEGSDTLEQPAVRALRYLEPEPPRPGVVAVGEDESHDGTLLIGDVDDNNTLVQRYNSRLPVTARIVDKDEEERARILEEQLRRQEEELQRMRAERENVAVAQVITAEQESQASDGEDKRDNRFSIGSRMKNKVMNVAGLDEFGNRQPISAEQRHMRKVALAGHNARFTAFINKVSCLVNALKKDHVAHMEQQAARKKASVPAYLAD